MRDQRDDAHLWRVAAFGGVELLRAHFAGFSFAPHAHEEFMIVVTEGGAGMPRFWRGEQRVRPGDLFVLNPGEVHGGGPARESVWRYRSFYIPAALMHRVAREIAGANQPPHLPEAIIHDSAIATTLRHAHMSLEEEDSLLAHESRLLAALASLVARHAVGAASPHDVGLEHRSVTRAKEYLEALPDENVSLDALAHAAGIGAFHLCRVFRRETGLSPHAYQLHMRMRRAKTLLNQGMPIARAAMDAGFADQAHFTRHFKRMYGVTPGNYRGGIIAPRRNQS